MMLGGSTTSLLSFLNCLDTEKYDVDLLLYRNEGELFEFIPEHVNLLPPAFKYDGKIGWLVKNAKGVLTGSVLKAKYVHKKAGLPGMSEQVLGEFQAKHLSRSCMGHYDYAIGFLEGWSDKYLAFRVDADKKYCWIHSTFKNIAPIANLEYPWMDLADKIVFVAEDCEKAFAKDNPAYADKSITVENIFDSDIIRKRSLKFDENDASYALFKEDGRFKIVTVCRLTIETKGLDRIVNCAKELVACGYDFSWYIIGDGEDRTILEEMIEKENLKDTIILLGMKTNPYPFVAKCDLMCMPSRWEGKPMTVTEAKILGVPPVVTNYLSAREQIDDGVEGIVVENTETSIIPVLKDILENPEKCRKMHEYLLKHEYGNASYMKEIEKILF
jgi:glycosyltransferase involved in cell wall biosynthesis